jgi:hypothetical protein
MPIGPKAWSSSTLIRPNLNAQFRFKGCDGIACLMLCVALMKYFGCQSCACVLFILTFINFTIFFLIDMWSVPNTPLSS